MLSLIFCKQISLVFFIYYFRYNNTIEMSPCISSCTEKTAKQSNILAPFSTHIMVSYIHIYFFIYLFIIHELYFFYQVEQTNKIYLSTPRFMSNITLPCEWIKSVDNQIQNCFCAVSSEKSDRSFTNESKSVANNIDLIWKEILFSDDCVSKLRTWESLGAPEFSKQSLFVTDLPETALHLARIRQTSILSLLPKKVKTMMPVQIIHIMQKLFSLCYS